MPRTKVLAMEFLDRHPADCARILENIPVRSVCAFISSIRPGPAAAVIEKMVTSHGTECVQYLDSKTAASVMSEMKPPQAARLLRAMSPQAQEKILEMVPSYSRKLIQKAFRYPEQTVGRLMDSNPFCLAESVSLSEAVKKVKNLKNHALHEVFIVDNDHKLTGVLSVSALLSSDRSSPVQKVMTLSVPYLSARSSLSSAARYSGWKIYGSLPVVEEDHTLVGVLKISTIMDHLEKHRMDTQQDDIMSEMFSMTKMYWIVMAELMGSVSGEEPNSEKAEGMNVKGN